MKQVPLCLLLCAALSACVHGGEDTSDLRLNDIQVIGSHNSYRKILPAERLAALDQIVPDLGYGLAYDHPSLSRQLDLGVRQLELDIFADPTGLWLPQSGKGFKVLHIPGIDEASHCARLDACLEEISTWSAAHPTHLPIIITVDAKDAASAIPGTRVPVPLDAELLDQLDEVFRAKLGIDRIISPDTVRGSAATLRDAVTKAGWPTLQSARGRFLIVFDVRAELAERYREGRPNLSGRAMFSLYPETDPEAAVMIVQDPRGAEGTIARWVKAGFYVRTRSDAGTREARAGDRSKLKAALASGAQAISTDYYPGAPDPLDLNFEVDLPGGRMVRCNPVRRKMDCQLAQD